jgi:hypothetical protein
MKKKFRPILIVFGVSIFFSLLSFITILLVINEAAASEEIPFVDGKPDVFWYEEPRDTVLVINGDSIPATFDEYNSLIWYQIHQDTIK